MAAKKEDEPKAAPASAGGSDSNLFAALAYLLGPIVAVIIYLVKKDDKYVRFHSMQSLLFGVVVIAVFIALSVVVMVLGAVTSGIGGLLGLCMLPLWLVVIVAVLYLTYMAFQGKTYKLPVIGDMAEKYV